MTTFLTIHAFDPGVTTGFTITKHDQRGIELLFRAELVGMEGWQRWSDVLWKVAKPDRIVVEAFRLYPNKAQSQIGSRFPSAEGIGIARFVAHCKSIPIVEQMATCKEAFQDDLLQKVLPTIALETSPHIKDAARHACYYHYNTLRGEFAWKVSKC
jgi:hypothetical protein